MSSCGFPWRSAQDMLVKEDLHSNQCLYAFGADLLHACAQSPHPSPVVSCNHSEKRNGASWHGAVRMDAGLCSSYWMGVALTEHGLQQAQASSSLKPEEGCRASRGVMLGRRPSGGHSTMSTFWQFLYM